MPRQRFSRLLLILLLAVFLYPSCTVTKRVHRKGWHISWNKNYKSSGKNESEQIQSGSVVASNEAKKNTSKPKESPSSNRPFTTTESDEETSTDSRISSEIDAPQESELTQEERVTKEVLPEAPSRERKESTKVPVGGPFVFMAVFGILAFLLLYFGALEFAIGALLIVAAAIVIIMHIRNVQTGKNTKVHLRPGSFYNSILFLILITIGLVYLAIFGGFSGTVGLIVFAVFVLLIGLLLFLIFQTKDLDYYQVERDKTLKEQDSSSEASEADAKRKQRIGAIVLAGFVVAFFALIAYLN